MMSWGNMCLTLFSANIERVSLDLILSMCILSKKFSDLSGRFFPILESATPSRCNSRCVGIVILFCGFNRIYFVCLILSDSLFAEHQLPSFINSIFADAYSGVMSLCDK